MNLIFLLFIFSTTLFSQNINKLVIFSSEQNKQVDLTFKVLDNNIRELGAIEIINGNSSPAHISYLKYDKLLAQSLGLKVTKFPNNGQIEFYSNSMTSTKWTSFFKTVKFLAPKLKTSSVDTLILKIPRMYKHNRQVSWDNGKSICISKGMRIPTKLEFQKVSMPHGEYWTNRESGNNAYFFRPPNWTQTMQKRNSKSLYCIGDAFDIRTEHIPEIYRHNNKQEQWDYGKKICNDKGMKLPTINELKAIPNLAHGEYWTNEEIDNNWAYMFRPPSWSQRMQKQNYKKLLCVRKIGQEISEKFKIIFTVKKVSKLIDKDFRIGAIPTIPETLNSLKTTFKKWTHSQITKKAFKGKVKSKFTIVNYPKIYKGIGKGFFVKQNPNTPFLSFHISTGLGVNGGQILWRKNNTLRKGGIQDKVVIKFNKPIVDIVIGFTGLGIRFIDSAKAVYELYYKGKLVRSRGKLDRSADFDGDGFVATNITTTNMPVDKMIFTIEIEGADKSSANYSIRYIVGNYLDSDIITKIYNIVIQGNSSNGVTTSDTNISTTPKKLKYYSFKIMDFGQSKNIMTKVSGENFKLDLYSYKKDLNQTSSSQMNTSPFYKHTQQIRWNDAKALCENKGMKLPTKVELQNLHISHGEYWTNREAGNSAYMFRPPNWTQTMQKQNGKNLYCVSNSNSSSKQELQDLNGTVKLKFLNSNIPDKTVTFYNENKKVILLKAIGSSKNIGIKIMYKNDLSFSEDNFSVRPANFEINSSNSEISGNDFLFKVKAVDSTNSIIQNYNETIDIKYKEKKSQCLTGILNIQDIKFRNGIFNQNINYSEIGDLNLLVKEKINQEFAKIDRNDGSGENRFIPTLSKDILFKYADIVVNSELTDFENNYTYISNNLNLSSAKLDNQIIAYNSKDSVVQNYSKNCYSENYSLVTYFDINTTNTNLQFLYDNKNKLVNSNLYIYDEVLKDNFYLGVFTKTSNLNFKRATNKPLNPIYLKLSDNNSSNIVHFYFARLKVDNYITRNPLVNIDYNYLIYSSTKPLDNTVFGDSLKDNIYQNDLWYQHKNVNSSEYNVSLKSSKVNIRNNEVSLKNYTNSDYKEYSVKVKAPQYLLYSSCCDYNMSETSITVEFKQDINSTINIENNNTNFNNNSIKIDNRINFNYRTSW